MDPIKSNILPQRRTPITTDAAVRPIQTPLVNRYPSEMPESDDSDGGIIDYWRILTRNKRFIGTFVLACALLGILVAIPQKPVYRAITTLEVLNLNDDFMNMRQSTPVTTNNDSYETSEEETQVRLLQSTALLDRVYAKLNQQRGLTAHRPILAQSGWRSLLKIPAPVHISERERLIANAANSLKVSVTPRTRVISASVDSTDPALAESFANTLTSEFAQMNLEARWASTHSTGDWISRELDEARAKLQRSEDALQLYARESGLIFTDENTNVATEKLQQIQQQLSAATADRIAKQSRFELAKTVNTDSLSDVLSDPGLRDTQAKISEIQRQIAELGTVFNPEYGKLVRARAELRSLQNTFERQRSDIVSRIGSDYTEALRKEQLLTNAYHDQTHEVTGQGEKTIQYTILKREVDSNRQLYDTMLQQMKQSSIASAMRSSNVRIVDPAKLLDKVVSPNLKLNAGLGALSGFFLGIALALIRERADRTLQQPGDAKLWTNLPELGVVPSATLSHAGRYYTRLTAKADPLRITKDDAIAIEAASARVHSAIPVNLGSKSTMVAEAFRSILTSILIAGQDGTRPRALVITSAGAADGKTTTVTNLAISITGIRRTVLVIDGDLRRPQIHNSFGLKNDRGLTNLLGQVPLQESALQDCIQKTEIEGLHVLTSGPSSTSAASLLYSPSLERILASCREHYDLILVDTPPMLQMTDARVIGRVADAVILIARAGKTTRDAVRAMSERLSEDGCTILGTILNHWNPKNSPKGYYGYYGRAEYNRYDS